MPVFLEDNFLIQERKLRLGLLLCPPGVLI